MFNDGDVICFLGDSLTANDLYVSEIFQHLKRDRKIKVYNCGVSGATASLANDYLYERCLCLNPNYVVTMFGINDINRHLCSAEHANDPDRIEKLEAGLVYHKEQYREIVKKCLNFGAKVILCVPPPFDEVSEVETENLHCQYLMDIIAGYLYEMGEELGLPVVNYAEVIKPMLGMPGLYESDRVHPTAYGQHIIARVFLKSVGEVQDYDFDRPFEPEEWITKRHNQFQIINYMDFAEFCVLYRISRREHWTIEQKKAEVARQLREGKIDLPYITNSFQTYIDKADFYWAEFSKLVELSQ